MSYAAVDVYVVDSSPANSPVGGVVVKVYDSISKRFITQGVTNDTTGIASFLLPDSLTYELRFFKVNVQFPNPLLIGVLPEPGVNDFEVECQVFTPPAATDPRLCRCSGFFRDSTGAPAAAVDMDFITKFDPLLLEGSAVLTERVHAKTDDQGYVEIDLIRFGQYDVTIAGFEDTFRMISVPDAPSVNLPDLLFPVVESVTFAEPGPYVVPITDNMAGNDVLITPTLVTSDGRTLVGVGMCDVRWSSSDNQILLVLPGPTQLTLRGISAGAAYIIATRVDNSIIRIPATPILGQPVPVTVE